MLPAKHDVAMPTEASQREIIFEKYCHLALTS
jgi:hypothetical protein